MSPCLQGTLKLSSRSTESSLKTKQWNTQMHRICVDRAVHGVHMGAHRTTVALLVWNFPWWLAVDTEAALLQVDAGFLSVWPRATNATLSYLWFITCMYKWCYCLLQSATTNTKELINGSFLEQCLTHSECQGNVGFHYSTEEAAGGNGPRGKSRHEPWACLGFPFLSIPISTCVLPQRFLPKPRLNTDPTLSTQPPWWGAGHLSKPQPTSCIISFCSDVIPCICFDFDQWILPFYWKSKYVCETQLQFISVFTCL